MNDSSPESVIDRRAADIFMVSDTCRVNLLYLCNLISDRMRRISTIILLLLSVCVVAVAAKPKDSASIKFASTKVDLGQIRSDKGIVTFEYDFTNEGTKPLVIVSVSNGGCGCTKPSFPKAPVAPGKSGKISISFNPEGRAGELNREVTVRTNGKPKTVRLRFTGVVIPPRR